MGDLVCGCAEGASAAAVARSDVVATSGRLDLPVFPDALGGFRDPANTRRGIRDAPGDEALARIASHNFRKTMATLLDSYEFSNREIADQLGHARPSMTQDVYRGRKIRNPRAAKAIENVLRRAVEDQRAGKGGSHPRSSA